MPKIAIIFVLINALSIAGCATGTYHPSKPRSEWANDHKDCERQARAMVREDPDIYGENVDRGFVFNYHSDEQRIIKECMRRKGWTTKYRAGE